VRTSANGNSRPFADLDAVMLRALDGPEPIGRHHVEVRGHAVAAAFEQPRLE
jgi:hypothetical protein